MAILLSMAAALTYGAADFIGGLMTKRNDVFRVVLLSQFLGAIPLLLVFPLLNDGDISMPVFLWGAGAGITGGGGVVLLYRGLAIGRMSVVAPITAVEAAMVPVLFGLATGERPGAPALAGVGLALVAVAFISSVKEDVGGEVEPRRSGIVEALGAGLAFGAFFIFLDGVGDDSGMWPLVVMRSTSIALVAFVLIGARVPLRPAPGTFWGIAAAGTFDVSANIFYLLSTREGLLTIVAVVTSMYPAMTVLLARIHLKERFTHVQTAGLGLAGAAITLIATG
ncbi:MAG: DMT family transporter [Actinomycetota bacterium]|nr:DMT family transporter [Actinomycetota bacterium]